MCVGSSGYRVITSGNCANAGMTPITTAVECNTAATALGLSDRSSSDASSPPNINLPEGCYWKGVNPAGSRLYINLQTGSRGNGVVGPRHPICKSAPTAT